MIYEKLGFSKLVYDLRILGSQDSRTFGLPGFKISESWVLKIFTISGLRSLKISELEDFRPLDRTLGFWNLRILGFYDLGTLRLSDF